MSKKAVRRVASISPSMEKFVKDSFETAMFTDMVIFTDEPDAMIGLVTFESIMGGIDAAIKETLITDSIAEMLNESIRELFGTLF